ncbi:hypothetical protein PFICI_02585 [Pestalotiopsis fici W106-1]|uniref:Fungal-specific transcription factor domain-containing protein n=1 Tax=Pestalotiopsis fici (strain W106-1 / CGMCC3.15140) TaxID=1229662 RepID=W3XET4_PESFW|nr:uncharacterized protein PFICI_02585 [Pestalotiopsis fici W106-1]ETS84560.1 hypothetical protein PFICI_02585 [Pestalotiopsis fici W106-1]
MPERRISWQPGFTLSRKPAKRPTRPRNRQQQFEIVVEQPETFHRRAKGQPATTTSQYQELFLGDSSKRRSDPETPNRASSNGVVEHDGPPVDNAPPHSSCAVATDSAGDATRPGPSTTLTALSGIIPPTVEYSGLVERFRPILTRYNSEFCTIPLTFKLRINPFRYRMDLDPEPLFLVHAVCALAGHHVQSTSMLTHRHAALQLLRHSLDTLSDIEAMYSVLDTIVILFSLDETQSLLGTWSIHLQGAYRIVESCGGIQRIPLSSRLETQIAILTWWDAIIALLSREECIFPYNYFESVLSNLHKREWDFFGLCGCPTAIVKIVMRLARLSTTNHRISVGLDSPPDDDTVNEIIHSLESWSHVSNLTSLHDEESMHEDIDAMHCSEAWRGGLLLYIFRVFQWTPGSTVPMHIIYRARTVVDHVIACRDTAMLSRQALLPLVFAGCELQDKSTRTGIVRLISDWDQRTRYHMFRGAIPILEEVWAESDEKGLENVWWGQIIDRQQSSEADTLKLRICFG